MKKLYIFVFTCILSISLFAQSNQGRITLGGGVNFESTTNKTDPASSERTETFFSIVPRLGYYISDAVKIGLGVGFTSRTIENKPLVGTTSKNTNTSLVINPFARFYMPASEKVDLFLEGNFSYTDGTYEFNGNNTGKTSSIGIFVAPGVEFSISQRISLDLSVGQVGYFTNTTTPDAAGSSKDIDNTFRFNLDLSTVGLGINILL